MKITIENPLPGQEEEIVIRAENLSPKILELLQLLKTDEEKLTGYSIQTEAWGFWIRTMSTTSNQWTTKSLPMVSKMSLS